MRIAPTQDRLGVQPVFDRESASAGSPHSRHIDSSHPRYAETEIYQDYCIAYREDDGPEDQRRPTLAQLSKLARPRAGLAPTLYLSLRAPTEVPYNLGASQNDAPPAASSVMDKAPCGHRFPGAQMLPERSALDKWTSITGPEGHRSGCEESLLFVRKRAN